MSILKGDKKWLEKKSKEIDELLESWNTARTLIGKNNVIICKAINKEEDIWWAILTDVDGSHVKREFGINAGSYGFIKMNFSNLYDLENKKEILDDIFGQFQLEDSLWDGIDVLLSDVKDLSIVLSKLDQYVPW